MTTPLTTVGLICETSAAQPLTTLGLICLPSEVVIAKLIIATVIGLSGAIVGSAFDTDEISARVSVTDGIVATASDADGGATTKRTGQITATATEC